MRKLGKKDYFWHIDDLCCDDEGNLYVADSGWNKIFKFSPEGKFLGSFGRKGSNWYLHCRNGTTYKHLCSEWQYECWGPN